MNLYLILKLVHIGAVILFLGNIFTGLFWMRRADQSGDLAIISFTIRGIIASDRWFTIPGVIIITAFGFLAAIQGGLPLLRTGWIFWSIILFTLSGLAFTWKVAPLQQRIRKLTAIAGGQEFDRPRYKACLKQWEIWGFLALLAPLLALAMMVLKLPARSLF